MTTTTLATERADLAETERGTYDGDAFPGSKTYIRHSAALKALMAFDAEHPEIVAGLAAEQAAQDATSPRWMQS